MHQETNPHEAFELYLNRQNLPRQFSRWITEAQLLPFLGISSKTLRNWRSLGKIVYTKFNGVIMYDVLALMEQLKKGIIKPRRRKMAVLVDG